MLFQKPESAKCQICGTETDAAIAFVGIHDEGVAGLLALCDSCLRRVAEFMGSMRKVEDERTKVVQRSPMQTVLDDWAFLKSIGMSSSTIHLKEKKDEGK